MEDRWFVTGHWSGKTAWAKQLLADYQQRNPAVNVLTYDPKELKFMHPTEDMPAAETKKAYEAAQNEHQLLEEAYDAAQYFFSRLARLSGYYANQERKRAQIDRLDQRIDSLREERDSLL